MGDGGDGSHYPYLPEDFMSPEDFARREIQRLEFIQKYSDGDQYKLPCPYCGENIEVLEFANHGRSSGRDSPKPEGINAFR